MLSLDHRSNDTSITLDLLRAVAAQMVCVGHALIFFLNGPTSLPYMQNVGVLLFFVLSGFLITHALVTKASGPDYDFGHFFVDRFARIYSGLIPALFLIVVVDGAVLYLAGEPTIARYYNFGTLVANLLMLEGYRGVLDQGALQWPAFGSASPLWTLAIEWHIYMFVGAVFFMTRRPRSAPYLLPVALFFGQTPAHLLFGAFHSDGLGRGLFALWLAGAFVFFAAQRPRPYTFGLSLAAVSWAAYLVLTPTAAEYDFKTYPLLVAGFFGLVIASQARRLMTSIRVTQTIRFFADYSMSLYLVHHTLMYALHLLWPNSEAAGFVTALIVSNAAAIGLAAVGERHHRKFGALLKRYLAVRSAQQAAE